MSLETATKWFDLSSIALAIGACVVFVATAAIVWLGIVKEHHWTMLREQANEKIAAVELETARAKAELGVAQSNIAKANAEIAVSNERAAEASQKAAEAQRDLERERTERLRQGPRMVTPQQAVLLTTNLHNFPSKILIIATNQDEADRYGTQIEQVIRKAGISVAMDYGNMVPGETVGLFVAEGRDDPLAIQLVKILNDSGIKASPQIRKIQIRQFHEAYRVQPGIPAWPYEGYTLIFVGHKPAINE